MKIGLCGTMSVGKTTLVNALKKEAIFKDYTFRTERSKYLSSLGIPLNTDSTFKGQLVFTAERSAELMQKNIITDRTIIDVMAFCALSEAMNAEEKNSLKNTLKYLIKEYDVILGNPPFFVLKKQEVDEVYYPFFDCRPNIFLLFIIKSSLKR